MTAKLKFLNNDNTLMVIAAVCSGAAAIGIPLMQWGCSAALAMAALRQGWRSSMTLAAALIPTVLAAVFLESVIPMVGAVLCIAVWVPMSTYHSARSWSLVSELLSLIALCTVWVIQSIYPEALDVRIELLKTQIASMPEAPVSGAEVDALSHVLMGMQFFTSVIFNFLFLVLMVRLNDRLKGHAVKAVGYVPLSHMYVFTWLGSIALYAFQDYQSMLYYVFILMAPAVCSGGSWIHTKIAALVKRNSSSKAVLWVVYYLGMLILMPWSCVLLALIALGLCIQSYFNVSHK